MPNYKSNKNIVDLAIDSPYLSTLVTALKAAKLTDVLSSEGTFTVFAPTDEAFVRLPRETLTFLLDPNNMEELVNILTYHVIQDEIFAQDLMSEQSVKTIQGQNFDIVSSPNDGVSINNTSNVITADLIATNGVVHIIDKVLMPSKQDTMPAANSSSGSSSYMTNYSQSQKLSKQPMRINPRRITFAAPRPQYKLPFRR